MACNTPPVRTITVCRREPSWSKGGATDQGRSEVFVLSADSLVEVAALLKAVRATLTVENRTLNAEVEVVFQATNDGCTWEAPVVLSQAWVNADGTDTTPWYSTATNFKRGIRFGVRILNNPMGALAVLNRVSGVVNAVETAGPLTGQSFYGDDDDDDNGGRVISEGDGQCKPRTVQQCPGTDCPPNQGRTYELTSDCKWVDRGCSQEACVDDDAVSVADLGGAAR